MIGILVIGLVIGLYFGFILGMIYTYQLEVKRRRSQLAHNEHVVKAEPMTQPITNVIPFRRRNG